MGMCTSISHLRVYSLVIHCLNKKVHSAFLLACIFLNHTLSSLVCVPQFLTCMYNLVIHGHNEKVHLTFSLAYYSLVIHNQNEKVYIAFLLTCIFLSHKLTSWVCVPPFLTYVYFP